MKTYQIPRPSSRPPADLGPRHETLSLAHMTTRLRDLGNVDAGQGRRSSTFTAAELRSTYWEGWLCRGIPACDDRPTPDGDPIPPSLSLAESDLAGRGAPVEMYRRCDIDSVFFRAPSLGIFRFGITLYLFPHYLQQIRQDQMVTARGKSVVRYKHLRLATGLLCDGLDLHAYAIFPRAKVRARPAAKFNVLNNKELAAWHDHVLLPAVRAVAPLDVSCRIQPTSAVADRKAISLKEWLPRSKAQRMNLSETLPQALAALLWPEIERRARDFPGVPDVPSTFFQGVDRKSVV